MPQRNRRGTVVWAAVAAVALMGLATVPAAAIDKQAAYDEMFALGAQISDLKSRGNEPGAAEALATAIDRYRQLSAQLGGDDPANTGLGTNESVVPGGPSAPQAAPAPPPGCVAATSSFANSTPLPIPDNAPPVTSQIVVSGAGTYLYDLDLTVAITHTFASDLDYTLTSPAGTVVTISTDNGGSNDDVFNGTLFDDSAGASNPPGPVTDNTYANLVVETPLIPEGAMAAFIGEDPNGTWTLSIADDLGLDTGTLNSWSLDVTTFSVAPATNAEGSFVNNTPLPIPDNAPPVTSQIVVSGATPYIFDVNLTVAITHTFPSDLDYTLTSPAGTVVTISTDNGGSNDDVFNGTLFDDSAGASNPPGPVTDNTYANLVVETPLIPEGAMGAFIGEDPNGTWTLTIGDDLGLDTGTLNSWSLDFQSASCVTEFPYPLIQEIPTASTLGLAALALLLAGAAFVTLRRHG